MRYVYQGNQRDETQTLTLQVNGDDCGTYDGVRMHRKNGTEYCAPCLDYLNLYTVHGEPRVRPYRPYEKITPEERARIASLKARGMKTQPIIREKCGTNAGYMTHYRRQEHPCTPCREAHKAECSTRAKNREKD